VSAGANSDHVTRSSSPIRHIDAPASLSCRPEDGDTENDLVGCSVADFCGARHQPDVALPIKLFQGGFNPVTKPRVPSRYHEEFVLRVNEA
jgi:hypothetical protein